MNLLLLFRRQDPGRDLESVPSYCNNNNRISKWAARNFSYSVPRYKIINIFAYFHMDMSQSVSSSISTRLYLYIFTRIQDNKRSVLLLLCV